MEFLEEIKTPGEKPKKMKRLFPIIILFLLVSCSLPIQPPEKSVPCPPLTVYFSPKGGAEEAIVKELENAKSSILVQAYSFTSAPIAKDLVAAHERGSRLKSSWTRAI